MKTEPISDRCAAGIDVMLRDYMMVRPGDRVLITTDSGRDPAIAQAISNAASVAGAHPATLSFPPLPFQGALADPYIHPALVAAGTSSDVWVDLCWPYVAGAGVYDRAIESGRIRYLLLGDLSAGGIGRLFAGADLDDYYAVHRAFDELTNASIGKLVRMTNGLGTDVSFVLAKPGFAKPRRAERPGMYLVPGSCTMFPEPDSVRGTIVVSAVFHEFFTHVDPAITLRIDGRVREISGGHANGRVLDRALRRASGGSYGHVIHFTHGIHPAARVTGESFIEDMRTLGNNAVGLGIPFWLPGGGENHPDALMFEQSIWIDGQQIVDNGVIVGPKPLATLAERLIPLFR